MGHLFQDTCRYCTYMCWSTVCLQQKLFKIHVTICIQVVQRETETKNVVDDIETRALELERQKALLEQELARGQEEVSSCIHTVSTVSLVPRIHVSEFQNVNEFFFLDHPTLHTLGLYKHSRRDVLYVCINCIVEWTEALLAVHLVVTVYIHVIVLLTFCLCRCCIACVLM